MIQSKADYKEYLAADATALGINTKSLPYSEEQDITYINIKDCCENVNITITVKKACFISRIKCI